MYLKPEDYSFISLLFAPMKGRSQCYRFIALQGVWTGNIYNTGKTLYKDQSCALDFFMTLENKQQIMQNNVKTTQAYRYVFVPFYIGSLCNVVFPMSCFTWSWLHRYSWKFESSEAYTCIALSSAFYTVGMGKKGNC